MMKHRGTLGSASGGGFGSAVAQSRVRFYGSEHALKKRLLSGGKRLNVPSAEPVTARQRSQQLVRLDSSLLVFALALQDELRHVLMLS